MFHIPLSVIKYVCAKYTYFFYIREKRLRGHHSAEETTDPPLHEEGDRDVVDPGHFTSESAQILIREIMGCNRDLENIQKTSMMLKTK
ncbi:hypothetical protein AB205_0075550 [Aquarana catesbeiana]|uniref:Uncharacterized protein n=1 Tax=Aquarana catesbeiana TaxID=8400 RepID=A0A2G9NB46_AQUCT|nr:hypothetical protein AB205_0075550 [Aquarana catesbeiana]